MRRPKRDTVAFGAAGLLVLIISIVLTSRRGADARAAPARFSGSTVIATMPSLLASPALPERVRVVVVRDDAAASYYDTPRVLDDIVREWRDALRDAGADVRIVRSGALAGMSSAQVLVVPSSPCLSIATREAMARAVSAGRGIILTGAAGTFDAGCRPIGYGLIAELIGASRAEPLGDRPMTYVTIPAGGPLSADIPPGARLELNPGGQVALRVAGRDAFYSDYALEPAPAAGAPLLDAAVAHAVHGRARIVYWGFERRDVVKRPWSQAVLALLARNSVAWAAGAPLAWVEPWPGSHAAAAVVAQDVEAGFANARYALDSLTAAHVRATFFVTSDLTRRNKQLTRMFAAAGEVGSHTENHRLLGGTSPGEQRERLGVSQRDLTALVGAPVRGLRPPEEQFDLATMAAWLDNGGTYLFGANDSRSAAPELLPVGRDTLLLLGRVTPDDFGARSDVRLGTDRLATAYLNDFAKMRSLGGLYVLSYHSQVLARPELVPVVARIARRLVADSATWVATAADIATWWRARAGLLVSAHTAGGERVSIDVRNRGSNPVSGAIVRVAMRSSAPARGAGVVVLPSDPGIVRIALPPIPGRATRRFQLSLAPPRRGRK